VKISMRVPPTGDSEACTKKLKEVLEKDPPYGAKVTFEPESSPTAGTRPSSRRGSRRRRTARRRAYFGKDAMYMGEGGTIPFMGCSGRSSRRRSS
jgi:hypothetical protein